VKYLNIILKLLVSVFIGWGCKGTINESVNSEEGMKPNIIFILTNVQRWNTLGYAGNNIIHTPNRDKLAKEGLCYT
jgi:hypothetical protein